MAGRKTSPEELLDQKKKRKTFLDAVNLTCPECRKSNVIKTNCPKCQIIVKVRQYQIINIVNSYLMEFQNRHFLKVSGPPCRDTFLLEEFEPGSKWFHTSHCQIHELICVTNVSALNREYPIQVVYNTPVGIESRPILAFSNSHVKFEGKISNFAIEDSDFNFVEGLEDDIEQCQTKKKKVKKDSVLS